MTRPLLVPQASPQAFDFAAFVSRRRAALLMEWQVAGGPLAGPANARFRSDLLALVLAHMTSAAEGRPREASQLPSWSGDDGEPTVGEIVRAVAFLRRLVMACVRRERAGLTFGELDLMSAAFEEAAGDVVDHYASVHADADAVTRRALGAEVRHAAALRRERFLADASRALAEARNPEQALQTIANLAVPAIADWCVIDLSRPDGSLERVAAEHRCADRGRLARALRRDPAPGAVGAGAPHVLRTLVTEYVRHIDDEVLQQRETDPMRLHVLRTLGLDSTICAPLASGGHVFGTLTVSTEIGRDLAPEDARMVEDLANRAAVVLHNARLAEEARRAVRAREEILGVVTHDLRTPLAVLATNVALMGSETRVESGREADPQRLLAMGRAVRHMTRLTSDLSDLALVDKGRFSVSTGTERAVALVRDALEALQPMVAERGSTLRSEVDDDGAAVRCDRDRVGQIFANLVTNAVQVGAPTVTIGVERRGPDVVFFVTDSGPGIAAEDVPHIFDRYYRRGRSGYQGTGLGLAIVDGIVAAHGGRIWLESMLGVGSTFFFTLPAA